MDNIIFWYTSLTSYFPRFKRCIFYCKIFVSPRKVIYYTNQHYQGCYKLMYCLYTYSSFICFYVYKMQSRSQLNTHLSKYFKIFERSKLIQLLCFQYKLKTSKLSVFFFLILFNSDKTQIILMLENISKFLFLFLFLAKFISGVTKFPIFQNFPPLNSLIALWISKLNHLLFIKKSVKLKKKRYKKINCVLVQRIYIALLVFIYSRNSK